MINQCQFECLPVFCWGGGCCVLSAFTQVGYLPQLVPSCWLNEHVSYAIVHTSRGRQPISRHVLPYSIEIFQTKEKENKRVLENRLILHTHVMIDLLFQEPLHACHSIWG